MAWLALHARNISRVVGFNLKLMWRHVAVVVVVLFATACERETRPSDTAAEAEYGSALRFRFPLPDGTSVSNEDTAGRFTILLFLTTYDPASQVVARRLEELARAHTPRINVLAVALEPPQNAPLVSVYRDTLSLGYRVALADQDTFEGHGPFGDVRVVPAMVLLDRRSRIVRRGTGVEALPAIESALASASADAR